MKKKLNKSILFRLLGGLATVTALIAMPLATMAAGNRETCTIYHHHTESCNGTVYVEQTCDGTSWLRTVATDTCTVCGDYHDYYQYDGSCSCGKTWYSTGHACINSPEGSNHGTCTNYSVIDCDTTHSHPTTQIVCGKTESTVIGTITVTRSITELSQKTVLTASYSGSLQNVSFTWKGATAGKQLTVTENGTYLLYASYTEGGVNYMQEMSVKVDNIDTMAPYISKLDADITTPVSGSVTLRVYAADDRGLPAKYVSWEGGDFTGNTSYEVTENGTYYVRVRDVAGNTSSATITVNNIDKEPPVIQEIDVSTTEYTSDEIVLSVSADDNRPFPDRYISWNDGEYTSETHYIVNENGLYTVRVQDAAGNFVEETVHIRNIDREPPEIRELKANVTTPISQDVVLSVDVMDNAELPIKYVSWNGGSYTASTTYKVSANGTYKVIVKDAAGNTSQKSIVVSNIDKVAPKISSLAVTPKVWYTGECSICVSAKDGDDGSSDYKISGLADKAYSWDEGKTWTADNTYSVTEEGTVTVFVRDVAGNIAKESVEVKKTALPTISEDGDGEESSDDIDDEEDSSDDTGGSEESSDDTEEDGSDDTGDKEDSSDDSRDNEDGSDDIGGSDDDGGGDDSSDNSGDGNDSNNSNQKQELPVIPVIDLNPSAPDNKGETGSIITPGQIFIKDEVEDLEEEESVREETESGDVYEVETVEKEEEGILATETPEEAHMLENKDSRAIRSLGKILLAILGCIGFLLLGFIVFILFGMCKVYAVSPKLKENYLGSVGISLGKGGFKVKIGNSIWENAESRNLRVKIPGWFVKMFAYKPLQIMVAGERIDKYVESEVDFHLNA